MTVIANMCKHACRHASIGTIALWFCLAPLATALAMAEPVANILYPDQQVALDFDATSVVYSGDGQSFFVAGRPSTAGETAGGIIVEYGTANLRPLREFRLPHAIDVLALSPAGDRLIAAGNFSDEFGGLSSMRLDDGSVLTARMQFALQLPSISVGSSGTIYLSHFQTNRITGIPPFNFDQPPAEGRRFLPFQAMDTGTYYFDSHSRIRQIIVSEEDGTIFVLPDDETKIYVMELRGYSQILGQAGYSTERTGVSLPLAAFASRVIGPGQPDGKMTFLLADHQLKVILLQEYDPKFRTIDLVTIADVGHALIPGTTIEFLPGSGSIRQPMLIAGDEGLLTILSANIYSRELVIFTRETEDADYLERVATLALQDAPSAIAVHPDGDDAVVVFRNRPEMLLLSDRAADPDAVEARDVQRTGEDSVRELQKLLTQLGFPVGSVDGLMGSRTKYSLDLAAKEYQLEANPSDLSTVIKELESAATRAERF